MDSNNQVFKPKSRRSKQPEPNYIFIYTESKEKTADKIANIIIDSMIRKGIHL